VKKAYFVCVGNAGRSQMAQALYERLGGEARSAGSRPEAELHQAVVEALEEVDIDVSARTPKPIARDDVEWADVVVTMGCGDACPVLPGMQYVEWNLPDPVGMCLEEVRELRAVIQRKVEELARRDEDDTDEGQQHARFL
jgi:arsenate reductase (thioredoxin)